MLQLHRFILIYFKSKPMELDDFKLLEDSINQSKRYSRTRIGQWGFEDNDLIISRNRDLQFYQKNTESKISQIKWKIYRFGEKVSQ